MTGREPAWRVFANEFQSAIHEETGTGERPTHYVLSPLGARMNRVLIVGTLSVPEPIGRDPSQPFLRARLTDPTGAFAVTAGGFQPRALSAFQRIGTAQRSMLVGKAHLYSGRDGVVYGSVRAEAIRTISEEEYHQMLGETLRHTLARAAVVKELRARRGTGGSEEATRTLTPPLWWAGAERAAERYPTVDLTPLLAPLATVLEEIEAVRDGAPVDAPGGGSGVRVTRAKAPEPGAPKSAAYRAAEAAFLDIIDDLADRSADGYADLKEAVDLAERRGIAGERAEELLSGLEESGVLEEPVVGKLRRA